MRQAAQPVQKSVTRRRRRLLNAQRAGHHQPGSRHCPHRPGDQCPGRAVGPVQVLDPQPDRALAREVLEQAAKPSSSRGGATSVTSGSRSGIRLARAGADRPLHDRTASTPYRGSGRGPRRRRRRTASPRRRGRRSGRASARRQARPAETRVLDEAGLPDAGRAVHQEPAGRLRPAPSARCPSRSRTRHGDRRARATPRPCLAGPRQPCAHGSLSPSDVSRLLPTRWTHNAVRPSAGTRGPPPLSPWIDRRASRGNPDMGRNDEELHPAVMTLSLRRSVHMGGGRTCLMAGPLVDACRRSRSCGLLLR